MIQSITPSNPSNPNKVGPAEPDFSLTLASMQVTLDRVVTKLASIKSNPNPTSTSFLPPPFVLPNPQPSQKQNTFPRTNGLNISAVYAIYSTYAKDPLGNLRNKKGNPRNRENTLTIGLRIPIHPRHNIGIECLIFFLQYKNDVLFFQKCGETHTFLSKYVKDDPH